MSKNPMNRVSLVGTLKFDPFINAEGKVANGKLSVPKMGNGGSQEFSIVDWNEAYGSTQDDKRYRDGDKIHDLKADAHVFISGELRARAYKKDGEWVNVTEVQVKECKVLSVEEYREVKKQALEAVLL